MMMTKSISPAFQAAAEAPREAIRGVEECTDLPGDVAWLESVAELLDHDDMAVMVPMSQRQPFVGA
jgi:hypothetical protein